MTEATSPNTRVPTDRTHDPEGVEAAGARRVILARRARYIAMALAAAGAAANAGPGCTQLCLLPPMPSGGTGGEDTNTTGGATTSVVNLPAGGSAGSAGAAEAAGVGGFAGTADRGPGLDLGLFAGMSPCLVLK